jgi:hypothetical protein
MAIVWDRPAMIKVSRGSRASRRSRDRRLPWRNGQGPCIRHFHDDTQDPAGIIRKVSKHGDGAPNLPVDRVVSSS